METLKSIGFFIADFLGIAFTAFAIIHFTLENVKGVTLLLGSIVYLCYKIYDLALAAKGRRLDNRIKKIEAEKAEAQHKMTIERKSKKQ